MLWVFITCGALTGASALLGWFGGSGPRRTMAFAAVVVLLALAWDMGHGGVGGWLLMAAAVAVEGQRRFAIIKQRRRRAPAVDARSPALASELPEGDFVRREPLPSVSPNDVTADPPEKPTASEPPPPFDTVVLLSESRRPAGPVFVASLRRAGEREAHLEGECDGGQVRVTLGPIRMTLALEGIASAELELAAGQSWDWPDAATAVGACVAGIRITTIVAEYDGETSMERAVRTHCRAHAALAEFLPVIAVYWPSAGRLTPVAAIQAAIDTADCFALARATCLNFRSFELDGDDAGAFLSDTLGLAGFGLRDAELLTRRAPDEAVSSILYHVAEEVFRRGAVPAHDSAIEQDETHRWRVAHGRSRIEPHRDVCRLAPSADEEEVQPPGA